MIEFKVKNKENGFVYKIKAKNEQDAIEKAIEYTNDQWTKQNFKIIKQK